MSGRANPGAQERNTRSGKYGRIVSRNQSKWHVSQRDNMTPLRVWRDDGAAVTDIGIGQFETGLFVVLLLRHHAIEPDHAWTSMPNGGVPYTQSVAAAAHIFPYNVQAEESEARGVIHARYGCGWHAVQFANKEALRIHQAEAGGIKKARIPAFGVRPVDRNCDFVRPHGPDAQVTHALTTLPVSGRQSHFFA